MTERVGTTILIVDDDRAIREGLRDNLASQGYHVLVAEALESAVQMLIDSPVDLLIADLSLSGNAGLEGLELIELARARSPDLGVVLLTAYGSPEVEAVARRLGAIDVLAKPAGTARIAELVRRSARRAPRTERDQ